MHTLNFSVRFHLFIKVKLINLYKLLKKRFNTVIDVPKINKHIVCGKFNYVLSIMTYE